MMYGSPFRCCNAIKHNSGVLALNNTNLGQIVAIISNRNYAKGKDKDCCTAVDQTAGKKVTDWPKPDAPPVAWRPQCPCTPQPPNYDPYKIKVPDIVVPPLPPSNAKPMLQCAKTKGPCSALPAPDPPPCPPPPPKPFPWCYVWAIGSFFTLMGLLYRFLLWREEKNKVSDAKPIWRPRGFLKRPYHEIDLPACVQYLIIGAGAAGWAAYRAIREHDKTAKVFFISKEDALPYIRPPMSKYMFWNEDPPDINTLVYFKEHKKNTMYFTECRDFMDPVKFYRKKTGPALSIAVGWTVSRVDADDHVAYVKTHDGEQPIYYERALIATGCKAKNLGIFCTAPKPVRERVGVLRTVRDLEVAYRKVMEAKHVTIVGGGVLGTELAWHLARMKKEVKRVHGETPDIEFAHVYKDKGILASIIPEYLGMWAAELIKCEGVNMMPQTQVYDAFMTPDNRLELTLSTGKSLVTDYVLVAIGSEPRTEMAGRSFLETDPVNGGFLVNTELEARTHLYVAGDVASIYSQWKDARQRMEHWDNAEEQGYIAGANMTGYWTPSNMEPHYWVKLGAALEMEVVGDVGACMPIVALFKPCEEVEPLYADEGAGDRICYKQSAQYERSYKRGLLFYLRDEIVVGFAFWNMPPIEDRKMVATELLRARCSYKDINLLAELLGFHDSQCDYKKDADLIEVGPCVKNWRVF